MLELKLIQKELNKKLKQAKERYSQRVREALSTNNSKSMWDAVKKMTNFKSEKVSSSIMNEKEKAL